LILEEEGTKMIIDMLQQRLKQGKPTTATRIQSTWPLIVEACAATGSFDYVELVAEYAPFDFKDLENFVRAAELHNIAAMIKLDFQNRFYMAQRAMASGFQAVLFTDHKTPEEVRDSIRMTLPDTPQDKGRFGYPNARWQGYRSREPQMEYASMVRNILRAFMIEKKEAMDNIEEICSIPGVDMVQFGPSDYCMSLGWNLQDHRQDAKEAEKKMIAAALRHGVHSRCEINTLEEAELYWNLGVRHFCIGDEIRNNRAYWNGPCKAVRDMTLSAGR
jgi:2-keto-3-deoxy-L-rhamnonate aldolase RhmA